MAVAPLSKSLYDGTKENTHLFRADFARRANACGWEVGVGDIINIPEVNHPNTTKDFIYQNQSLSKEDIVDWAQNNIVNQQTRAVQNNFNAVQCLESSLDNDMQKRLLADRDECKVGGVIIAASLFNVIMSKSEPSGMGTVRALKEEIRALDTTIPSMKIDKFNDHVNAIITTLSSHQVKMPDLIDHLFSAYKRAADNQFREHISEIERKWLRGEERYDNYTASKLMADALAEYNLRVSDKSSPWGALSEEQEEIMLLKAEIKKVTAESSRKKKRVPNNNGQGQGSPESGTELSGKAKIPKWKLEPPTDGSHTKTHKGKTYNWCKHHYDGGMWALHDPKECKNRSSKARNDTNAQNDLNREDVQANMAEESDDPSEDEIQASLTILAEDSDEE
jgi:hypothetical protein